MRQAAVLPEGDGAAGKKRELKRDTAILREFDASKSPDVLALYFHIKDASFDAFNAGEYTQQMIRYCSAGYRVVMVAPRKIAATEYALICLQHTEAEKNALCQLAFLCFRQFAGAAMLVKKRCFKCHAPAAKQCTGCRCAFFCSPECQKAGWAAHKPMCKLIKGKMVQVDECLDIEL